VPAAAARAQILLGGSRPTSFGAQRHVDGPTPAVGLVAALGRHAQEPNLRQRPAAPTTHSERLLAAKRRATRR
jgi:hypothetical protein